MRRAFPSERLAGISAPEQGLAAHEVDQRRARFGDNQIVVTISAGWREVLRESAKDPMLGFLLGAGLLFGLTGQTTEAVILMVALIPVLGMDAYLHRRARASIEGLNARLADTAEVVRDGRTQTVAATALVPGDVALVSAGGVFPADGLIVAAESLQVDESSLTGESQPLRKEATPVPPAGQGGIDGVHWGFAGTRVLAGSARLLVGYTGGDTLYGEIVRSAVSGVHERTPLQLAVANLVKILLIVAAVVCVVLAWVRLRQGHGAIDALLSALTLAVAALPEEFPVVLTFFLGAGVYRLARRQALVRRAVVVENIGRVTCVCSDKTGTITEGRLRLAHRFPAPGLTDERLLTLAAAASRQDTGDPLDMAILETPGAAPASSTVACFPFTEDRKRETGVFREGPVLLASVKGAPEVVLGLCELGAQERMVWATRVTGLAGSGHKVIACAWRRLDDGEWYGGEPDRGFQFAGMLAFEDPVRAGVGEALQVCQRAGIHVVMVTGDHPATALAIAREIGLGGGSPRMIEADALEGRLSTEEGDFLRDIHIVARAVPAQKLGLVRALQSAGEIVAVTGDGVNDVPALQAADIGIAMGGRGTRSAREVAAIVLLDDNLRSIVRAIAEGRQLFANLQLSFQYLLMIHIPLVITAAAIPLAGDPLLYLPIHIVWLELIIHPTALLVFQDLPPSDARLARITRDRRVRFFSLRQWLVILLTGMFVTLAVTFAYDHGLGAGLDVEYARAMAMVALTLASAGITAALSGLRGTISKIVCGATLTTSLMLVQTPLLAELLHIAPLQFSDWITAAGMAAAAGLIPLIGRLRSA